MKGSIYYTTITTKIGDIGIVWRLKGNNTTVVRIFLPREDEKIDVHIRRFFPKAVRRSHGTIKQVGRSIVALAAGHNTALSEKILDMELCGEFQSRVLNEVMRIPKGKVSTYGRLASKSGVSRGARAAGNALATNPYPLIIPCHRVIRSDGSLGGFGGGLKMKKALLMMEGITFDSKKKVLTKFLC